MDTELLVECQFDDGQRLVDQLIRDDFEISVAFWLKTSEEGLWHLYIASPFVDEERLGVAYRMVYASLVLLYRANARRNLFSRNYLRFLLFLSAPDHGEIKTTT